MAVTPPCLYKTVNLSSGETFVLPPGAEVISVSDASAITSSCPSTDLPEQELKCYRIRWVLNKDPEGLITYLSPGIFLPVGVRIPNINNAWEDDDTDSAPIIIEKIVGAGTEVVLGSNCRDLAALETQIRNSALGGLLSDRKYQYATVDGSLTTAEFAAWGNRYKSGYVYFEFYFKTIEEFGSSIYLEFGGGNDNIGDIPRFAANDMDCTDYPTTTVVTSCD